MIEKIVLEWLREGGIDAYMEMPEDCPGGQFCLIEKTGSTPRDRLAAATVAVQSYGDSLYDAAALNERAKARMAELYRRADICRIRCNSDYNFTDTARKRYRYQAVFDILHYARG